MTQREKVEVSCPRNRFGDLPGTERPRCRSRFRGTRDGVVSAKIKILKELIAGDVVLPRFSASLTIADTTPLHSRLLFCGQAEALPHLGLLSIQHRWSDSEFCDKNQPAFITRAWGYGSGSPPSALQPRELGDADVGASVRNQGQLLQRLA